MAGLYDNPGLGQLLQGQMKYYSDRERDKLDRQLRQQQIEAQRAKIEQMRDPRFLEQRRLGNMTAAERNYERLLSIPEGEQRSVFQSMVRAQPEEYLAREGAVWNPQMQRYEAAPNLGAALGTVGAQEISTQAPAAAQAEAMKVGAATQARISTESKEAARQELPQIETQANEMLGVLEQIESHPGLSAVVGAPEIMGGRIPGVGNVPGTRAADFQTLYDRLEGQKFKQAYETLKGGGQITEIESKKAEAAAATMSTAQSEKEFLKGLREYKGVIEAALKRSRIKAGVSGNRSTPKAQDEVVDFMEYFK